jgi:hypothetical protein
MHPVEEPPPDAWTTLKMFPQCARDHVYLFFITGLDPFDHSNLTGLIEYCRTLGFNNSYYGQMWHGHRFADEVRRIRREDPEARIVLVGFSFGANVMKLMANSLHHKNDIPIDLLVYLGGNTLENVPENRPDNVLKVVHILATGYIWKGHQIDGVENCKLADAWHFDSPTHPHTLAMIAHELAEVVARVPVVEVVPGPREALVPVPPEAEPIPAPVEPPARELPGAVSQLDEGAAAPAPAAPATPPGPAEARQDGAARDEWDFLKSASQLTPPEDYSPHRTASYRNPFQRLRDRRSRY